MRAHRSRATRLETMGRVALRTVTALDAAPRGRPVSPEASSRDLATSRKVLPGWAVRLFAGSLLLAPFVMTVDALAAVRRAREPGLQWLRWTLACALPFVVAALFTIALGAVGLLDRDPRRPGLAGGPGAAGTRAAGGRARARARLGVAAAGRAAPDARDRRALHARRGSHGRPRDAAGGDRGLDPQSVRRARADARAARVAVRAGSGDPHARAAAHRPRRARHPADRARSRPRSRGRSGSASSTRRGRRCSSSRAGTCRVLGIALWSLLAGCAAAALLVAAHAGAPQVGPRCADHRARTAGRTPGRARSAAPSRRCEGRRACGGHCERFRRSSSSPAR